MAKDIEIVEYDRKMHVPLQYYMQAEGIFWEKTDTTRVLSAFSRQLGRTYYPQLAQLPEYTDPLQAHLAFGFFPAIAAIVAWQFGWILTAAKGEVKGKRVLDLGCGSTGGTWEAQDNPELYKPWLCRALLEFGAYPIGFDIGDLSEEKFEAHEEDLLVPNAISDIPESSVDIAHSRAFFTSPQLQRIGFMSTRDRDYYLMQTLMPQIKRVLKPGGVFIYCKDL